METNTTINGRTPEEIKKGLEYYAETDFAKKLNACKQGLKYWYAEDVAADALAYIQQLEERVVDLNKTSKQLERERDAAVRTARWQFERRGKDGMTKLPVCSWCGATPKYYAPMNSVGMQTPPHCHECGSRMSPLVKMEVE